MFGDYFKNNAFLMYLFQIKSYLYAPVTFILW